MIFTVPHAEENTRKAREHASVWWRGRTIELSRPLAWAVRVGKRMYASMGAWAGVHSRSRAARVVAATLQALVLAIALVAGAVHGFLAGVTSHPSASLTFMLSNAVLAAWLVSDAGFLASLLGVIAVFGLVSVFLPFVTVALLFVAELLHYALTGRWPNSARP
jgi:hypothetical protein